MALSSPAAQGPEAGAQQLEDEAATETASTAESSVKPASARGGLSPLAGLAGAPRGKVVTVSVSALRAGLRGPDAGRGAAGVPRAEDQSFQPLYAPWEVSAETLPPQHLLGCWLDSRGHTVVVESMDAPLTQLTATLSRRKPQPDIRMSLWQTPDGSGWFCGEAKLVSCWGDRLVWAFPDGRVSEWQWQAFTPESLAMNGLAAQQELGVPSVLVPVEGTY